VYLLWREERNLEIFSILVLAFATSLDSMMTGVTYGLRKIKIPISSLLIIGVASTISVSTSMVLGGLAAKFLSTELAEIVGGLILIVIGFWILYQSIKKILVDQALGSEIVFSDHVIEDEPIFKFRIKSLEIVIKILNEPIRADFDYSGEISMIEAVFLGLALALDALGVGFGAAMASYDPFLTSITVGVVTFICLSAGLYLGKRLDLERMNNKTILLPGIVLIILGIFKLF